MVILYIPGEKLAWEECIGGKIKALPQNRASIGLFPEHEVPGVVQMQLQRLLRQSLGVPNVELSGVGQHEVAVLEEGERGAFPVHRNVAVGHPHHVLLRLREPHAEAVRVLPHAPEPRRERPLRRRNYHVFVGSLHGEGERRRRMEVQEKEEDGHEGC